MAEIVQQIIAILDIDDSIHWFCPRSFEDQSGLYYDEDRLTVHLEERTKEKPERLAKIEEADKRRNEALNACTIFAFDGADAESWQRKLNAALTTQLQRCDICIREFHRSRSQLKASLEADYETETVQGFMQKFDSMNIMRIGKGLNVMTETLLDLPPEERTIGKAGEVGMYALFEALNCGPFLCDEGALRQYFDRPFGLVQSRKKLKLSSYAPGVVAFLFSNVEGRSSWAYRNFTSLKRPFTSTEFEHSVKPFLEGSASHVTMGSLEVDFLPTFWKAVRLIVSQLTTDVVTHHFRSIQPNLYTLSMDQWQLDANHFCDMIACYQMLLEKSPQDFWEAMGAISGQSVVEQIFKSPVLQHMIQASDKGQTVKLEDQFAWVLPFVRSIKPANLVMPARALFDQLLHICQRDAYSKYAQSVTWQVGLRAMLEAVNMVRQLGGGPVVVQLIEVISTDHLNILEEMEGIEKKHGDAALDETEDLCLKIVEATLAADVQCLAYSRSVLLKAKSVSDRTVMSGLGLWKAATRLVEPGEPWLAASILSALTGLLPQEKFTPRQVQAAPANAGAWNKAHEALLRCIQTALLDRIEAFTPDQLIGLYQEPKAARGLMSLLFSGETEISQATLSVFKTLSGEDNRRDTVMHLVKVFFSTTLESVANAQSAIAKAGVFAPAPIFLKLTRDVLSCLCDTQDGVLRTEKNRSDHFNEVELFWEMTWTALETIFRQTEPWSSLGYDKQMMQDFCRDTMDLADTSFNQYPILASTLRSAPGPRGSREIGKDLLKFPTKTFNNITKWLRLRDEYLIARAVGLTCKMLAELEKVGIEIDQKAAEYIEQVYISNEQNNKVRTKLTPNQKAELQQALEKHLHAAVSEEVNIVPKRRTLNDWATSGSDSGRSTPIPSAKLKAGTIDLEAWTSASRGTEALRRMQEKKGSAPPSQKPAPKRQVNSKEFLLKRKQEMAAAERRRAEALAKQKLGAGSGVAGLGDMGKDHSMKGQNVMISSDEEESEEDDMDDDLFGTKNKMKIQRPNVDPDGAVGLKPEVKKGPTRIQRTIRSVKDMRARLAPDLQPLHKVILKWDFFHDGDYPPGANTNVFERVKNSYSNPVSYREAFEPLLTLEAWQNMVKSREENTAKPYEVKIQNRSNVDHFLELSSIVSQQENRELQLNEGDIVLLSKAGKPSDDATSPHCLARICKIKRQKAQMEVVYQVMPGTSLAPSLVSQAQVYGQKIQSLTPLEREYGAMQGLQYYDLCTQIIKAAPSKRMNFSEKQIAAYQDVWNVNRAQSEAVNAALENEGFSLIQGPPGSGKTKTIIAIVGGLLSQSLGSATSGAKPITMPRMNGAHIGAGGSDAATKKLLVCAPSNAAVDELVMRLKEGVTTKGGRHHSVNVVRIGRSDAINSQVIDVTMDELVTKRLGGNSANNEATRAKNADLFKEHESVSAALRDLYQKRDSGAAQSQDSTVLENEIASVRRRKNELGVRIDNVKDQERNAGREAELSRKRAQQAVLDEAHVICATLSGSGHDMFQSLNIEFETVIIDEAAQCVEMSSLIPLKYGCIKCIMVGDPKQLPPTVFSKEAAKFQYEQSLFVRMQNNHPEQVHLLDTQYRMHPDISVFPSRTFYDGLLKDGTGMASLRQRPWHASAVLAPYRFFDVHGQHQSAPKGHSLVNIAEVEIAMALYERLISDFKGYEYNGRIGIITPYKSQLRMLRDRFSQRFGNTISDVVEFNTTDAFQGRESEIIIFSCVRASPAGGIGFLQDIRRMNVGLTRAKSSLWVLGNSDSLSRGQYWRKLVEDARARDAYITGDLIGMLR
ncbi:hypothetical protein BAUCODRAFT_93353, partial [Baudoinia panamericana UAMH 10762]